MLILLSTIVLALAPLPADGERVEDFEEAAPAETIAGGWRRVTSPRHPSWNRIERVRDPKEAGSGEHYLRMTSMGGSTALEMLPERAWKVDPGRSYRLSVLVRVKEAKTNVARVAAIWLDGRGAPLGEVASPPVAGRGPWREVILDLPEVPDRAAAILVRLAFEGDDVAGECGFDRVVLQTPPRLKLYQGDQRLPVVEPTRPSRFFLLARQIPQGRQEAAILWRNPEGEERFLYRGLPVKEGTPLALDLPPLEPGAHALIARLSGPDAQSIEREWTILAPPAPWLAEPGQKSVVGAAFDPSLRAYPDLRQLTELAEVRLARVALWHGAPERAKDLVLELNRIPSISVVGFLDRPPPDLFPDVDPAVLAQGMGALKKVDRRLWQAPLETFVRRYREFVPFWQPDDSLVKTDDLSTTFDGERVATIDAEEPADFLRKLVLHAAAEPGVPAFVPADRLVDPCGVPKAAILAVRAANDVLSGAIPRPELVSLLGAPVRAAFEKGGRIVLVLWGDGDFTLGADAESFRPLGGSRRHAAGERLRVGALPLFVGKIDPSALERRVGLRLVDPAEPSGPGNVIALGEDPATRLLRLRNRSKKSAMTNLRVKILDPLPRGWVVRPLQSGDLSMPPGKEVDHELTILLPRAEEEGERSLEAELRFTQDGKTHTLREKLTFRIVPQIDIDVQVADAPGLPDGKRVSIRVFNRSAQPMTLVATVRLPDRPEQAEPLGTVEPRSSAERVLEYVVRDLRLVDPARLKVEVLCGERAGDRRHARKVVPLK